VLTFILIIVLLSPVIREFRKAGAREKADNDAAITPDSLPNKTESTGAAE
jgi:hypothetical protein